MFSRPVLFFSNYCPYSKEFLNALVNSPLVEQFVYINIDADSVTKRRSDEFYSLKELLANKYNYNLNSVPTIIVENGEFILKDKDAFEWLNYTLNTMQNQQKTQPQQPQQQAMQQPIQQAIQQPQEISGFNPNEMTSFSDMYSTFGLNIEDTCMDAKNQCFQFLGNDFKITTPDTQPPPQQQNKTVRFSNDSPTTRGGISKGKGKGYGSEKEKEIMSKYEQMMAERQNMDKKMVPARV